MAGLVTDRLSRPSTPDAIEQNLAALWRELAERRPATRTLMSNLVIFRERPPGDSVDIEASLDDVPIADVVRRHPSRVIVLMHTDDAEELQAPVAAAVSLIVFESGDARHAVEHITIRSSCAEASLPSIVRGLALGDLPTSVWWTEDISKSPPLTTLVTMGRQFVYDSRQWKDVGAGLSTLTALLAQPYAPDLADVNWRRLAPLRRALRRELEGVMISRPTSGLRITVRHPPAQAAGAWLLLGWLCSELEHQGKRQIVTKVEQSQKEGDLTVSIAGSSVPKLSATMSGMRVTVLNAAPGTAPTVMAVPVESEPDAIAAELSTLGREMSLVEAIRAAHARFTE